VSPAAFPRLAIRSGENFVIYGLSRNPEASLTAKLRNKTPRKLLLSDLPSKPFAGAMDTDGRRKVIF
jgi:hypothetical protein